MFGNSGARLILSLVVHGTAEEPNAVSQLPRSSRSQKKRSCEKNSKCSPTSWQITLRLKASLTLTLLTNLQWSECKSEHCPLPAWWLFCFNTVDVVTLATLSHSQTFFLGFLITQGGAEIWHQSTGCDFPWTCCLNGCCFMVGRLRLKTKTNKAGKVKFSTFKLSFHLM